MSKTHTPGPWKTRKGFSTGTIEIFAPNPKIKKPFQPTALAEVEAEDAEGRANAKLLAAAPDLLAALETLMGSYGDMDGPEGWDADCRTAYAALDKARGKSRQNAKAMASADTKL